MSPSSCTAGIAAAGITAGPPVGPAGDPRNDAVELAIVGDIEVPVCPENRDGPAPADDTGVIGPFVPTSS